MSTEHIDEHHRCRTFGYIQDGYCQGHEEPIRITTEPEPLPEGVSEGTVIHGTLRTVDLISAFALELGKVAPELVLLSGNTTELNLAHEMAAHGSDTEYAEALGHGDEAKGHEAAGWLLDELRDALDDHAPNGWTFGNTEGDGSDFGWWRIEEDDDE